MKRLLTFLLLFAVLLTLLMLRSAPPDPALSEATAPAGDAAEPQALYAARSEEVIDGSRYSVSNLLAGPLQIEIALSVAENVVSQPALPMRVTLSASAEREVVDILAADPALPSHYVVTYDAVPGSPRAQPDSAALYGIPFGTETPWTLDQGYHGDFTHQTPQARFALDFAVPVGTLVRAARAGTVMQIEDQFQGHGLDLARYASRANHVRILHDDGGMADYAHLRAASVLVALGQRVDRGDPIAQSGETGYTTGPHLHFVVQVNRGMRLESIPFRMPGVDTAGRPE